MITSIVDYPTQVSRVEGCDCGGVCGLAPIRTNTPLQKSTLARITTPCLDLVPNPNTTIRVSNSATSIIASSRFRSAITTISTTCNRVTTSTPLQSVVAASKGTANTVTLAHRQHRVCSMGDFFLLLILISVAALSLAQNADVPPVVHRAAVLWPDADWPAEMASLPIGNGDTSGQAWVRFAVQGRSGCIHNESGDMHTGLRLCAAR